MQRWFENNRVLMLLSAIVFIGGYFFMRLAYQVSDQLPFTQEIILIILGTLATILITALLLNKQTSVELAKEQSIKFIELKTETYQDLINTIEEMVLHKDISKEDLIRLKFHTHRLAIFASPAVLGEYENFLIIFNEMIANDRHVSLEDEDILAEALAKLTVHIRADLVGELDAESGHSAKEIREQIIANAR